MTTTETTPGRNGSFRMTVPKPQSKSPEQPSVLFSTMTIKSAPSVKPQSAPAETVQVDKPVESARWCPEI